MNMSEKSSMNVTIMPPLNDTDGLVDGYLSLSHRAAFVLLWSVGLLLNVGFTPVVAWVMWKRPTWPTVLLFLLTFTDAMVVVFGLSVSIVSVVDNSILRHMSPLCTYQSIIINSWYLYSYIIVLAISLDRYLAVCHPFVYNKQLSNRVFMVKGAVMLVIACLATITVSCLPLMIGADIVPVKPGLLCFFDWTSSTTQNKLVAIVNIGIIALAVGLLIFFTTATGCGIFKIVDSSRQREGNMSLTQKVNTQSDNQIEVKFAKLMIVVVILFAACNLPFMVVIVVQMFSNYHSADVGYLALAGLLLGTQINPVIHAMVQRSVRKHCYNMFKFIFGGQCCQNCLCGADF